MKFKIALFISLITLQVFSQIEKIEPPFWWNGMHLPQLEILCYGKNISKYNVSIDNVEILAIKKTENPNYIFITIDTQKEISEKISIDFKYKNKIVFSQPYEFKKRKTNSSKRKGFDSSDVMYLIMPDRFANGNAKNDSHPDTKEKSNRTKPGGRHGGDIEGIIKNLDYLSDLGVTTLWSTPLLEDNESTYSYHTYAQSDLYKIDPRYGTNEDYKRLATEMHKKELKLVMDYVTNHWGGQHWMMSDLPTREWIHQWPEGFRRSNYRMTTQFDSNASSIDAKGCMDGWFDTTMPDINQSNPLVLNYITQNAIWWIEYADLDGLRVDTYSYNDKLSIAKWTKAIMDEYPNFNIVGEVWMHDQAQMAYWQKDSKIGAIQSYNSYLPSVMDFTLHDALMTIFNEDEGKWNEGMIKAYDNFANDFLYPDINNILVFMGNHDTNRINEIYQNNFDKYKLALSLILTTRGIPQLYYGDEIGMLGNRDKKGDGDIRRDFPGGWENDEENAFIKERRTNDQEAFHGFTKKILQWRKNKEVIHTGKLLQYIPENNVYVFFRYNDTENVMIVLNNNPKEQHLNIERFKEGIKKFKSGVDIITGKEHTLEKSMLVAGKSVMILELKK